MCSVVTCHTRVLYNQYTFLCARWLPVILVYCRLSIYSYVLGGYLSYSCTLDLVHIPMCSVVSCHTRLLQSQYTFICARWFPVILEFFRFSTHSYVHGGYLSYSCTLDLVHIPMCSVDTCHTRVLQIQYTFICARWFPVILVYFRFSTHFYVLGGYLSYSCTLDLVHILMCTAVTCHTRVL